MSNSRLYARSRDGRTIHLLGHCHYARSPFGIEWDWAHGKTVASIQEETAALGIHYQWCRRCFNFIDPQPLRGDTA
jgi:hypothetical protein